MKLYYFDIYGRAESIRMLLDHAKQPFEDIRLTTEDFKKLKEQGIFEFGQVPVLEMNGKFYAQSISILRMLGQFYGYYPENQIDAWKIDSNLQANTDMQEQWWEVKNQRNKQQQQEHLKKFLENQLPNYFRAIEKRVQQNKGSRYIVGDKVTIADFDNCFIANAYFYNQANQFSNETSEVLQNYRDLDNYYKGLGEEFKEYLKNRPQPRPF